MKLQKIQNLLNKPKLKSYKLLPVWSLQQTKMYKKIHKQLVVFYKTFALTIYNEKPCALIIYNTVNFILVKCTALVIYNTVNFILVKCTALVIYNTVNFILVKCTALVIYNTVNFILVKCNSIVIFQKTIVLVTFVQKIIGLTVHYFIPLLISSSMTVNYSYDYSILQSNCILYYVHYKFFYKTTLLSYEFNIWQYLDFLKKLYFQLMLSWLHCFSITIYIYLAHPRNPECIYDVLLYSVERNNYCDFNLANAYIYMAAQIKEKFGANNTAYLNIRHIKYTQISFNINREYFTDDKEPEEREFIC